MNQLEKLEKKYQEIEEKLASPEVVSNFQQLQALARERSSIQEAVTKYRDYKNTIKSLEDTKSMLESGLDEEMASLAREEIKSLQEKLERLREELRFALIPKDPNDEKDIIMEIRGGTGGEEAGIFAADLYRMYTRYAQTKGWAIDVISCSEGGSGGFKEMIFEIRGSGAYSRLKYERGVHRVQRIPTTEASGRIHTSTATVAVLPKAEEVDIAINPDDLRMEFYHSGGAGGQNVNKVATAVRIIHEPSGVVVTCQDERSQLQNRMKAMALLRSRLLDEEQRKQSEKITSDRRSQVGSAERAEKIRTYNFPQDRVTDHRFGITMHNLPRIMEGDLDGLIDALTTADQTRALEAQAV